MKNLFRCSLSALAGMAVGILVMWVCSGNEINNLATTYCFGKINEDTTLLRLLRAQSYQAAADQIDTDLSDNLLYVSLYKKSPRLLATNDYKLVKFAAAERSKHPYSTGIKDLDSAVEKFVTKVNDSK